jgi:peroxiredoxin
MNYLELPDDLPVPVNDGECDHLLGMDIPDLSLPSTDGCDINIGSITPSRYIIYCYPLTGNPASSLPCNWDKIPGARGCTPQAVTFKLNYQSIRDTGFNIYGLSTQSPDYQKEFADRMELPFSLLSDEKFEFCNALKLPMFEVDGVSAKLVKRLTLIVSDKKIIKVFYPIFPPTENANNVLSWLQENVSPST